MQFINILGTEYSIEEREDLNTTDECDGICYPYTKAIYIMPQKDILGGEASDKEARSSRYREVMRHEIIHAFFHESGIDYEEEEEIVAWIARQFPKLQETFKEMGCED